MIGSDWRTDNASGKVGTRLLLRNARLQDGSLKDVMIIDGSIAALGPLGHPIESAQEINLAGYLLLPSLVEPHCHFDKVFTDALIGSPAGDVVAASRNWHAYRKELDFDAVRRRAVTAARTLVANGVTAIRTHVDVGLDSGIRFVNVMSDIRRQLKGMVDFQVVAFVDNPLSGAIGAENKRLLAAALDNGADIIGGAPYQNTDSKGFQWVCLELGIEHGCGIDFHVDETTDATVLSVRSLARQVKKMRFPFPVAASHCVSLGVQSAEVMYSAVKEIADAGLSVVSLPQCNLFLQGRRERSRVPRGLAPLQMLLDCGVTVAAGGDNYQDPFNPVGRCDPLETASILVTAAHLSPEEAFDCVTRRSRRMMGLPEVSVTAGCPADLLAIRARSLREAVAIASPARIVLRNGKPLAESRHEAVIFGFDT